VVNTFKALLWIMSFESVDATAPLLLGEIMKAKDVFTPGRFPTVTYVEDHLTVKKKQLEDTLDAGSMLISISGPSKSGKTVFVEQCLGKQNLIQITGAGAKSAVDLWMRVFDIIGTPITRAMTGGSSIAGSISAKGSIKGGVVVAQGRAEVSGSGTYTTQSSKTETQSIDHLQLLIKELGGSDFVIFIDDFHYVPREVQGDVAQQIKEAIRNGVKFICASVPYHSDDVIRGNPDLRGRVFSIDFDYWNSDVLEKIAFKGFKELNIIHRLPMIKKLATEAAGSPQLMQYLCLNSCYALDVRERLENPIDFMDDDLLLEKICRQTALSADYGSVLEKMKEGPKTRGSDRKIHTSTAGWQGDVYRLLVKALSLNPPQLTFRYQSLIDRISATCVGDSPSGSSITSACYQTASIVNDAVGEKIVEWDPENDVFDIRDPYLLFYLRWSDDADN
jgi:hypothetical protein